VPTVILAAGVGMGAGDDTHPFTPPTYMSLLLLRGVGSILLALMVVNHVR
jgi:hypothetical protein